MHIKLDSKGLIKKGTYANLGELIVKKATDRGGYYIYIWPNDGTKWKGSNEDIVYDEWLENWEWIESYFKNRNWEIEWYDDNDKDSNKASS